MNWLSFALGFVAFPVFGALALGVWLGAKRLLGRRRHDRPDATLSFSPRLIGEIGDDYDPAAERAKAS